MPPRDLILIANLELKSPIGITAQERSEPQRLTVSLEIEPEANFPDLEDDITRTVDYFTVTRSIQELALARPRNLIETLAEEIAELVLRDFPVARVTVELRKYILPDTEYVAVKIIRLNVVRIFPE